MSGTETAFKLQNISVGSFNQRSSTGEDQVDPQEYVFQICNWANTNKLASSMSDNSLSLFLTESLQKCGRVANAHSDTINSIEASMWSPSILISASSDRKVKIWDNRTFTQPVAEINHSEEVMSASVAGGGSLLASCCGNDIVFYDIRYIGGQEQKKWSKLGKYSDAHSDEITNLKFHPVHPNMLVSGGEDGLICVYDTSTAEAEDAVVTILNTECPVNRLGFFGQDQEGIYSISTVETLSFWHYPSAQKLGHFGSLREDFDADYLVDCCFDNSSGYVYLVAGKHSGEGLILSMEPSRASVVSKLTAGHKATIRCACLVGNAGEGNFFTGGEDSRLCNWKQGSSDVGSGVRGVGNVKIKGDNSNLRFNPY